MQVRLPHFGHLAVLLLLVFFGLVGSTYLTRSALHFHLFGVTTAEKAATDIHYTIGFMAGIYFIAFALAAMVFPLWWRRSLFSGLQWNAAGAARKILPLLGAAAVCFVLALVDQIVLPGPTNAPIDKMFDSTTAAWLLLIFGITVAPFFEEIVFRGFLLPSLCTAFDWYGEKLNGNPPTPPDANGHPQWSLLAMILASICTSIPFAGMHAEQTGYSIGPFVLLVAVSLMLCWARLHMRSLAASVLVHATYNGMLFGIMVLGTGGFRHLDKM
jgi:membrane protease YdiL (CAAX protease family)